MVRTIIPSVVTILMVLAESGQATSFTPYAERCIADSNGHYYVIVKRKDGNPRASADYGPVSLTIAERRAGSASVRSAMAGEKSAHGTFLATADAAIKVRDGDIVHGRIDLDQPPKLILVSSTGNGIVTLDKYGFNGIGPKGGVDDVVVYSLKGEVLHRKDRSALFDEKARRGFYHGDGFVAWLNNAWLDEKRGDIVIVGMTHRETAPSRPVLTMNFSSGEVRVGGTDLIDRAISERNPNALSQALDLAKDMKLAASKAAWPGIFADEKLSLHTRLQAAVLLSSLGDQRGVELIKKAALDKPATVDLGAQYFAVRNLPEVLGDKTAPVLCEFVRRFGEYGSHAAWSAIQRIPAVAAVPELRQLLDRKEPVYCQLFALECLGDYGPAAKAAVPDMIKILIDEPRIQDVEWTKFSTHKYAAGALGQMRRRHCRS